MTSKPSSPGSDITSGVIRIIAGSAAGRIVTTNVLCDRPRGFERVLAHHSPGEIPGITRRLFSLCGGSHSIASAKALAMAGAQIAPVLLEYEKSLLAAERLAAHLQATFIGWRLAVPPSPIETSAIVRVLSATARAASDEPGFAEEIIQGLAELGLSQFEEKSWAGRLLNAAEGESHALNTPDPLTDADDALVLESLKRDGEVFAGAPHLARRRPETGPAARAAWRGERMRSAADRLSARLHEIIAAANILGGKEQYVQRNWVVAGSLESGTGFCALETPRGRLYHLASIAKDQSILRYLILAPTEWNFANNGPLAAALSGVRIMGDRVPLLMEQLIGLYDPCVVCEAEVVNLALDRLN